jgi:hypothetical protein
MILAVFVVVVEMLSATTEITSRISYSLVAKNARSRRIDAQKLVTVAGSDRGLFRRTSHCSIRPAGEDSADHPMLAQQMGPGRHAPLIMECKFHPGCSLMPWTR